MNPLASTLPSLGWHTLWPANFTVREWRHLVFLCVTYVAAAQLGTWLFVSPAVLSPAPAIALAGLFLGGLRLWPAIFAGVIIQGLLTGHVSSIFFLLYPLGTTVQALLGAYLLMRFKYDPVLRRLTDMFTIIGVVLVVSTIVPTTGFLILYLDAMRTGATIASVVTWGTWWTGYFLSMLIVAPLIMRWIAKPGFIRTKKEFIETVLVITALCAIAYVLFWTPYANIRGVPLLYLLFVPLFWSAIRFGPRFTILSLFLALGIGVFGTLYGPLAPGVEDMGQGVFQLEIFFIILAIIFYIVTGLQEERRVVMKQHTSYIDQLEHAFNKLSLQDRAKSDFVAVLAHELRNPLAPIVSSLELLRMNLPPNSKNEEILELMDNRLKTIQRLLDDLLDVSRISQSKLRLKKETIALRPIIDRSIQSTAHYLKARNQTLMVDIADERVVLDADPVRIEQIITNLLVNASKFTPNNGHITISKRKEGNQAVVRVKDTGIGIDPKLINRIFEPFTQLGKNTNEGLGIGLSLTQKLAEMHGGTIEAQSEGENLGSEFIVRLPLLQGVENVVSQPGRVGSTFTPPSANTGVSVLVVDDNEAAAQGIQKLLQHKGYTVDVAYNGMDAKKKISKQRPSVVVLDIGLPDIDGYEIARQIRQEDGYEGILIALTGYGQEEDRERAYEAGFNHHLTKPISIVDLEPLIAAS